MCLLFRHCSGQLWRRALHVAPAWPDLYANLASALVTRSQPARAEAWLALRAAVRLVPTDGRLYARLGALVVGSQPLAALARPALRMVVRFAHAAARLRPWGFSAGSCASVSAAPNVLLTVCIV